MPQHTTPTTLNPAGWWRRLGFALPNLAVCGDLDTSSHGTAAAQLDEWVAAGITDIVDARGEWSDERLVADLAPGVRYHWVGTDDDGNGQSDDWFDRGVAAILTALADPDRKVVVHCHMGVNRGPSMAFAALLALGLEPVEALTAIRDARPIAAVLYVADALRWWHRRFGHTTDRTEHTDRAIVGQWMAEHPVDVAWVISRIRRAGRAA